MTGPRRCQLCGEVDGTYWGAVAHAHDLDAAELAYIDLLLVTGVIRRPEARQAPQEAA